MDVGSFPDGISTIQNSGNKFCVMIFIVFCWRLCTTPRLSGCDTCCNPLRVGLIDPCNYLYSNESFWLPLVVNHRCLQPDV